MRTKILLQVLFLTSLFICKAKANEVEPNKLKAQACTLALNTTDIGKIEQQGDKDWWKVTTNADGELDITINALNDHDIGVNLYVYDKDGKKGLGVTGSASGPGTTKIDGLAAGTYYIEVECGLQGDTTFYSLTDSLIPVSPANDAEPNGMISQAKLLPLNGFKTGHVGYYYNYKRDTADWYKVTTNVNGQLDITVTRNYGSDYGTGNHGINAWLVDGDKTTIIAQGGMNTDTYTFTKDGLAPGTYYVKIFSGYGDEFESYTISNQLEKTAYKDVEPNDYALQADSLPVNKTKKGNVGYRYNTSLDYVDWYKITTKADGLLKVTATPLNGEYMLMHLYKSDTTQELAENYNSTALTLSVDNLPAGVYYVKLQAYYYVGFMNYTITDSLFKHNMNAISSNATNQTEATVKNIISVYPNPASSAVTIQLPGKNTYSIEVFDASGKLISKYVTSNVTEHINVSNWKNGVYYLKISSGFETITQKIIIQH